MSKRKQSSTGEDIDPRETKIHVNNAKDEEDVSEDEEYLSEGEDIVGTYTQGPLDDVFGQHAAFPISYPSEDTEMESAQVYRYLSDVRKEAEIGGSISFVPRIKNNDGHDDSSATKKRKDTWNEEQRAVFLKEFLRKKGEAKQLQASIQDSEGSQDKSEAEAIIIPDTASEWRKVIMNTPPPSIDFFYSKINHMTVIKLIIYSNKWLSASCNKNLSDWIFRLFLRLDNLLDHTEQAIVRELGKKAIKVKDKVDEKSMTEIVKYTTDMMITIVGDYYGQKDLLASYR